MNSTVGLGLRHSFHEYVLKNKPAVPFFEVITENYLFFDGAPRSFLRQIRENYPLAFHGVSLSIGSLEPIRTTYLTELKKMIEEFQPLWISDHLCWTYNGSENSHDLLPIPFTRESLKRIVSKVQQVQELLGQKIYLENPSAYVDFSSNEYLEEDYINELSKKSGCGLLLDLNNLVVNQHNLGYNPVNYLNTIKHCDVKQIHLAGHTIKDEVRIDTHDSDISQEVLDLLPLAKIFWPDACPMIEWDDKIPAADYLLTLREKIEADWRSAARVETRAAPQSSSDYTGAFLSDLQVHQNFWNILKTKDYVTESRVQEAGILKTNLPTPAHVGMNVYSSAYYNRQLEVLGKIFPSLKVVLDELFSDVMLEYLERYPSNYDSIDFIGNNLAKFIEENKFSYGLGVDQLIISDIAKFESCKNLSDVAYVDRNSVFNAKSFTEDDWTNKKLKLRSNVSIQMFHSEIHHVISSIQKGQLPEIPELRKTFYLFYSGSKKYALKPVSEVEVNFFSSFSFFKTFTEAVNPKSTAQMQMYANLLFEYEELFCVE